MTAAGLAFLAAVAGLVAAWDLLCSVPRLPLGRLATSATDPVRLAGRDGREPTPSERRRLAVLAAGALLAGGWMAAGPTAGAVAAFAGPWLSITVVRARRRRYAARVRDGAAEAARALADAVAAGHAVRGAMTVAAPGVPGAAGHELRLTAAGLALGEPTQIALERLRERAGSRAWDTLVAALLLQREAGGDLAGLLRRLAAALEAAARAEADARSATAQARSTAYLVAALPAAGLALAELGSPGFLASLVGNPLSAVLAGAALLLQATALVVIRHLARSEAP